MPDLKHKPSGDNSIVSGLAFDDTPADAGDSDLMSDRDVVSGLEAAPQVSRAKAQAPVSTPRVPLGPWREEVHQDHWLLTQSQDDWLHPFALLGPITSFKEYRAAMAACADFLSKEAAHGRSTPDHILRSERFRQCQGLDEAGYLREKDSLRWHGPEWYGLKQFIGHACADDLLAVSERRVILARAQDGGFDEKEILRWIRENHPTVREEPAPRGSALLRGVFEEEISSCDAFVDYVSSSSKRWTEAVQKRGQIAVVAPNLVGEEGRRLDDAVTWAGQAVTAFRMSLGLKDDPRRDDGLWLLAVIWKAGSWKDGRPVIRLPNPWEGEWVHDTAELVRVVDARPDKLNSVLRSYQLPFWLAQDPSTRELVRRIVRDAESWEANAWQVLWVLGERRIRIASAEIREDAGFLGFLSEVSAPADLAEIDRMLDNRLIEAWATRLGHTTVQEALGRAMAITDSPERRRASLRWSLGAMDLVSGVNDTESLLGLAQKSPSTFDRLFSAGLIDDWSRARKLSDIVATMGAIRRTADPDLRRRQMAWRLGDTRLVPGVADVDAFVQLAVRAPEQAIGLIRNGSLAEWLPSRDIFVSEPDTRGKTDLAILHLWLWAMGQPVLLAGGTCWKSRASLLAALDEGTGESTRLLHQLGPLMEGGVLQPWLESDGVPAVPRAPETPRASAGNAWKWHSGGQSSTFAEWLLAAARSENLNQAGEAIKKGYLVSWLKSVPDLASADRARRARSLEELRS